MGGTSLWLKPQMAWPSAQHGTAGFKGLRLTAGRRPKGDYVGPIRSPRLDRSRRYVGPMLALCWPMSALRWPYVGLSWPYLAPMLALCWPKLALSCPYVGPMLAYVGPMLALCWASVTANYVKTPSTCHFFPSGALPERQNHVKRVVF